MQASSSTKMSSSTQSATPQCGNKASEQPGCVERRSQWKDALVIIAAGLLCTVPILALTASAFSADPTSELGDDGFAAAPCSEVGPDEPVSEIFLLLQAFIMGWACCLAFKLCHKYGGSLYSSGRASLRSFAERVGTYAAAKKDALVVIGAGIICMVPIVGLIVSAFVVAPGSEPGEDGLASEGSSVMRAFTMGWMFCLALKLSREFVGLVGSSSCMALLSC